MKRAPKSLNARVGPWNSSRMWSLGEREMRGASNWRVLLTIVVSSLSGMSSPKKALATAKPISWKVSWR